MAAIGIFGKLKDTIVPVKGVPFNLRWESLTTLSGSLVSVFSATNSGATTMWISKIYASGEVSSDLELHVDGAVVWDGGTTVVNLHPPPWDFTDAEFPVLPGKAIEFFVKHAYGTAAKFTGNVAGFIR